MLATVTITLSTNDGNPQVFVDATCAEGEDLSIVEALGMLRMAEAILLEQA